jgi:hypothetical protein
MNPRTSRSEPSPTKRMMVSAIRRWSPNARRRVRAGINRVTGGQPGRRTGGSRRRVDDARHGEEDDGEEARRRNRIASVTHQTAIQSVLASAAFADVERANGESARTPANSVGPRSSPNDCRVTNSGTRLDVTLAGSCRSSKRVRTATREVSLKLLVGYRVGRCSVSKRASVSGRGGHRSGVRHPCAVTST